MICPTALIAIPRPVAIVIAPIRTDGEGDDRHADRRAIAQQRDIVTLVRIIEVAGIDPAAQVRQGDIAPTVIGDTTHYRHLQAARQLRNDRIILRGAGAQIDGAVGVSHRLLSDRRARYREQRRSPDIRTQNELSSHLVFHKGSHSSYSFQQA
jgi:hypothetical protein